jgi:hypothetical protein
MKNRKWGVFINLAIVAVFLAVAVWLTLLLKNKYQDQLIKVVVFAVIGLTAHYQLSLIVHELGHTLLAKSCKMNVKRVNFGLFSVDCENKKIKLSSGNNGEAGEILFASESAVSEKQIKLIAFGGLLFSALYVAVCYLSLLFIDGLLPTCLMLIGGLSAVYLLFVNVLPIDKTSDGAILLSRKQYPAIISAIINHQTAVERGEIPSEQEIFKCSEQPLARYYHYLYLMLEGCVDEAQAIISKINDEIDELTDEEYNLIFPEIITSGCLNNALDDGLNARAEIFFDEEINSPAFLRAHYLYRRNQGESTWAEGLRESYLKTVESAPLFLKEIERHFDL